MMRCRSTFALLVIIGLGGSVTLPSSGQAGIRAFDRWLYETCRAKRNGALDLSMGLASELGHGHWLLTTGAVLWSAGARQDGRDVLVGVGATQLGVTLIKTIVNRRRPIGTHSRFTSSFPSGHTAGVVALVTVLTRHRRNRVAWGVPLWLFAGWVGYSRVYRGHHFPLDVMAGGALGLIGGQLTVRY